MNQSKVETLFQKFGSIYGTQKVAGMWAGSDMGDIKADWSRQLDRVSGAAIGAALQHLVDTGSEWPPTMGVFIAMCKEPRVAAHGPIPQALPAPEVNPAVVSENMAKIKAALGVLYTAGAAKDPMFWAKRPKSRAAVELLARGALHDRRLADILRAHLADGGEQCRGEDAVKALLAMAP